MDPVKELEGLDFGHFLALVKKMGGRDKAIEGLKNDKEIIVRDKILSLFNKHGCVKRPEGFGPKVKVEDDSFKLDQLSGESSAIMENHLARMTRYLPSYNFPSLDEFTKKCEAARTRALENPLMGENTFARCFLYQAIPQIPQLVDLKNLGQVVEDFAVAAERAYLDEFSDREFNNYLKDNLSGKIDVVSGVGHAKLLREAIKAPQAGILLPGPLQGWSIEADRKIISSFPDFVSLAGIEYLLGMIGYPGALAHDWKTPGLDLAALSWRSAAGRSIDLRADDGYLDFDDAGDLSDPYASCSGGLFLRG